MYMAHMLILIVTGILRHGGCLLQTTFLWDIPQVVHSLMMQQGLTPEILDMQTIPIARTSLQPRFGTMITALV
jgi:hypothetical protein